MLPSMRWRLYAHVVSVGGVSRDRSDFKPSSPDDLDLLGIWRRRLTTSRFRATYFPGAALNGFSLEAAPRRAAAADSTPDWPTFVAAAAANMTPD